MSQTSSGLEPVFRNFYIRRRKLSHNEKDVVADFIDDLGDKWLEYKVYHHNLQEWINLNPDTKTPGFFVTSDEIDWEKRSRRGLELALQMPRWCKPKLPDSKTLSRQDTCRALFVQREGRQIPREGGRKDGLHQKEQCECRWKRIAAHGTFRS